MHHALRLGPRDPWVPLWLANWAVIEIISGRYDQAIERAQSALQRGPSFGPALRILISALALGGNLAEAKERWSEHERTQSDFDWNVYLATLKSLYKNEIDRKRFLEGLIMAGAPIES